MDFFGHSSSAKESLQFGLFICRNWEIWGKLVLEDSGRRGDGKTVFILNPTKVHALEEV